MRHWGAVLLEAHDCPQCGREVLVPSAHHPEPGECRVSHEVPEGLEIGGEA